MSEPEPGAMHPVDEAFYRLAIKERDYERLRVDRLTMEVLELKRLVLAAPSYLGARQALHNHWLDEAEKVVGRGIYDDNDL
jgi:hypothetical protein